MPGSPHARVLVTGATGYMGRTLVPALLARGHSVVAVVRPGAAGRAPVGAAVVEADVLDRAAMTDVLEPGDCVVHLVGTPRPTPTKGALFRAVDLPSIQAVAAAASTRHASHVVYVSVAHPAPVMRDYVAARQAGEAALRAAGVPATVLRPWYVLGPGHWWPYVLLPAYWIAGVLPATRATALRLGLVTHHEMRAALVRSIEDPPTGGVRVLDVPAIRGV